MTKPRQVFLSYANEDKDEATELRDYLEGRSVSVFFAPRNISPGQNWIDALGQALQRCEAFVVLVTSSAISSMWVKRETQEALTREGLEGRIVPIVCSSLNPSNVHRFCWVFKHIQWVQRGPSACKKLLQTWGVP